jgi:acyl dehydratase
MGYWLEDMVVGLTQRSAGRTITEADLVAFSSLSGDFSPVHTDADYCSRTDFGVRIAHGMLSLSYMQGLMWRTNYTQDSGIASLGWEKVRFLLPVLIGDTVHVEWVVVAARESTSRPGQGIVTEAVQLMNQDGLIVLQAEHVLMVKSKLDV